MERARFVPGVPASFKRSTRNQGRHLRGSRYEAMMTPYEKGQLFLRVDATVLPHLRRAILDAIAYVFSDKQAADSLQKADLQPFAALRK